MFNNGLILTGKNYVVQIYKIKLHTKNINKKKKNQRGLKFAVKPDSNLVTGVPDPVDIFEI